MRRLSDGYGADIIVDSLGGDVSLSEALRGSGAGAEVSPHARLCSEPKNDHRCDEPDLEGREHQASSLFAQPVSVLAEAWTTILQGFSGRARSKPIIAKTFPLESAAGALRYLVEGRPFGRVLVTT